MKMLDTPIFTVQLSDLKIIVTKKSFNNFLFFCTVYAAINP